MTDKEPNLTYDEWKTGWGRVASLLAAGLDDEAVKLGRKLVHPWPAEGTIEDVQNSGIDFPRFNQVVKRWYAVTHREPLLAKES